MNSYKINVINNLLEDKKELELKTAKEIESMIRENFRDANKNNEYSSEEMEYLLSKRKASDIIKKAMNSLLIFFEDEKSNIIALGMVALREGRYEATTLNVKKEYKGLGLAKKICDIREKFIIELGAKELYIESLKFENTIRFHKKRAFYKTAPIRKLNYTIYMKKDLI